MSAAPVHFEVLPNGLTLLLRESHSAPVAALQFWTRVGSADERPNEAGLAHFHEHMLFKGTERRGVGEVAGDIEGVGGRMNAYTSFDVTVYHATLPSSEVSLGIDVLVDAVRNSIFDPAEIDREIEVVLEEIRRSDDTPGHVLGDAVFATCYQQHPYRAPILGSRESVSSLNRDRVQDFFQRWYAPDHLAVVASGDFSAPDVAEQVRRAFEDAVPNGVRQERPAEPTQNKLRSMVLRRPFERATLDMAFVTVGLGHPDAPFLDLLAYVLGEGESSRLVRRIREQEGFAERIDASSYTPLDPGLFNLTADFDPDCAREIIAASAREFERLRAERVSDTELEKARANFLASEHFERESVDGLAGKLGGFQLLAGDWRHEAAYLDRVRRATPEDLQRVARAYLSPERLSVGVLLPEDARVELDDKRVAAAVEQGVEHTRRTFTTPAGRKSDPIHSYPLANGGVLHVHPRREIPVVGLRAAFLGGQLAETETDAGITRFMTDVWMRGTRGHSASDLARAIESLAVDLDGFAGRNSFGLTLDSTSDKLDAALDLLTEVLLEPLFDDEEIERQRRETLGRIKRREDSLGAKVFELFGREHYHSHPYRLPLLGTPESVQAFDREGLLAHHQRLVRGQNLVVSVSGDVDPDRVAGEVGARLSELSRDPFEAPTPPEEPAPDAIREIELQKDREQTHLVIGFRGLRVSDADRHALEVIAQLLAGQGGRLFLQLRDRQSLAYSVSALNVEGVAPGFFATYIATAPDKFDEAREGMLNELRGLLEAAPDAQELERAKRYLIGNFAIDEQRNASRALHIALDALYGLGPTASLGYADRVSAVSADDVLRVAREIIDLDRYTSAVVHP